MTTQQRPIPVLSPQLEWIANACYNGQFTESRLMNWLNTLDHYNANQDYTPTYAKNTS